jgi:hypothetical protein
MRHRHFFFFFFEIFVKGNNKWIFIFEQKSMKFNNAMATEAEQGTQK